MWACGNHYYQNNGNIHSYPPYESSSHFITIFPFQKCPLQFLARQLCPLSFSCSTTLPPLPLPSLSLLSACPLISAIGLFDLASSSILLLQTHQWQPSLNSPVMTFFFELTSGGILILSNSRFELTFSSLPHFQICFPSFHCSFSRSYYVVVWIF